MGETLSARLISPRIEAGRQLRIAGLCRHYTPETMMEIPAQWQRLASFFGKIPGRLGRVDYGVCFSKGDGVDYLSGVEVAESSRLPAEFVEVSIPALTYAVFPHRDHVSKLCHTIETIWNTGLEHFGRKPLRGKNGAPAFFERYGEDFDPQTGMGGMEVWVPIKA